MTENKPIIDKVNVKECKYYCNGKCERYEEFVEADYANYSVKCICEKENDLGAYDICDYQQLIRKTQECEELKKEQAEIKKYLGISHKTILERLEELTDFRDRDREQLDQLEQTLTEIKEIAEENDELLQGYHKEWANNKLILQKISEAENE